MTGAYERGHDLAPMTNDAEHRVWLSGDKESCIDQDAPYPKPVKFGGAASRDRVQAFGTQRDGRIVQTWSPKNCGVSGGTDIVFLFNDDSNGPARKIWQGSGFYEARPVTRTDYRPNWRRQQLAGGT